MVSSKVVEKARRNIEIQNRYNNQELDRVGGNYQNIRRDWTPAQKRRMRKNQRAFGLPVHS